ncbi:unnamed protein product [Closterium sp. Yama58-4]|nr:unnamed protein product [Closterium sp. Yama58-4]
MVGARISAAGEGGSASWLVQNGGATCDISVGTHMRVHPRVLNLKCLPFSAPPYLPHPRPPRLSYLRWIPSSTRPAYASTCPYISSKFNCVQNGRPDGGYQHLCYTLHARMRSLGWPSLLLSPSFHPPSALLSRTSRLAAPRRSPLLVALVYRKDCPSRLFATHALPPSTRHPLYPFLCSFSPLHFALMFQDKTLALVGDSNAEYLFQSLRCQLSTGLETESVNTTTAGAEAFRVISSNTLVLLVDAPFLSYAAPAVPTLQFKSSAWNVHLDVLHPTLRQILPDAHAVIFSSGSWFMPPARTYYKNGRPLAAQITGLQAHSAVLGALSDYLAQLRSGGGDQAYAVSHSAEAAWTASERAALAGSGIQLLDILGSAMYRPDGHVATYGSKGGMGAMDCSGWCLPGVPDAWVDMFFHLYASPTGIQQLLLGLGKVVGAGAVGDVCWQVPGSAQTIAGYY